jgi:hypothetical protein
VLGDTLNFTDPISVNRLVHTYVSLLHVPYQNPQSDDYTTDFRVINGEVIYTVNIDRSKYIALLDTGSNVSLIHSNIFRKLHPSVYEIIPIEHSRTASLANGNTMTLSQLVRLNLTIQGRTVLLETFVSPDITYELIIDMNFFLQNNIDINFYTKTLHFVHTAHLRMAHTITIQPYSIAGVFNLFGAKDQFVIVKFFKARLIEITQSSLQI